METIYYAGMDVHKDTVRIAVLTKEDSETVYERTVDSDPGKIVNILLSFKQKGLVIAGYEAGCLGYTLYRNLVKKDIACRILAPNKVVRSGSDKIKTGAGCSPDSPYAQASRGRKHLCADRVG